MKNILYWLPRILTILLLIAFIAYFFKEPLWVWSIVFLPGFIFLLLLLIAWKYERVGGLLFMISGISLFVLYQSMFLSLPLLIIGIMFFVRSFL